MGPEIVGHAVADSAGSGGDNGQYLPLTFGFRF